MISGEEKISERAMRFFAQRDLQAEEQTKITLFLIGIKSINIAVLSKIYFQDSDWAPFSFLHSQYHKEIELSLLLHRNTTWSFNPLTYAEATRLNMMLWKKARIQEYLVGPFSKDRNFFNYLALTHAFMSEVRFFPLFPNDMQFSTPFLITLYSIDVEHGRQIQTQIRLIKETDIPLTLDEKEKIIEKQGNLVKEHFLEFLTFLCEE